MQDILRNTDPRDQRFRGWLFSFLVTAYATIFMLVGNSGDVDVDLILEMDPIILLLGQGFLSLIMFVVFALVFTRIALKINPYEFFQKFSSGAVGFILLITISFMVINSAVAEWNMTLDFPDSSFEDWAKRSEGQLRVLTEHLTNFVSPTHFLLALLVVAVIPAVGEELLFRGLLQNLFAKAFSNHHIAIWVSGFIFAAIHMQFYGLVPRMLLGVLFGYLYYWSGNLSLAMIAHFINNGFALTMLYLAKTNVIDMSQEQMESSAPWPAVLIFGIGCGFAIYAFHKKYKTAND